MIFLKRYQILSFMSLDDKFMPEDGTLITKFDNFMIRQARKIGNLYQEQTGRSYKELTKKCYEQAMYSGILALSCTHPVGLITSILGHHKKERLSFRTPLEEEIDFQSWQKFQKYTRASWTCLSYLNAERFVSSLRYNDQTLLENINTCGWLISTASLGLITLANYLEVSNLPEPPKKKAKKTVERNYGILASHQI